MRARQYSTPNVIVESTIEIEMAETIYLLLTHGSNNVITGQVHRVEKLWVSELNLENSDWKKLK